MKFLDLFSGIGGFRLGMEQAGHECVGHIEIDKCANLSYAAMHKPKESEFFGTDIRTVEPQDLPEADIYCGGFPCQSFSIAGKRGGFEDTRGTLFFEVAGLVKERKPKIVLLENVKGLLSHDKGNTFETIIGTLGELGYFVEWQVFNSKNFNVPQNRERVFIVGHLGTGCGREVFPIRESSHEINEQPTGVPQQIASTLCAGDYKISRGMNLVVEGYDIAEEGDSINLAVPNSKTRRGRVGKGVANTLDTSCNQGVTNNLRIRRLTPKECFRLQGFPDEYFHRAESVCSNSQLYKQAGNSVTVNVIYEMAKRLQNKYIREVL